MRQHFYFFNLSCLYSYLGLNQMVIEPSLASGSNFWDHYRDHEWHMIDGTIIRAHRHAAGAVGAGAGRGVHRRGGAGHVVAAGCARLRRGDVRLRAPVAG